MSSRNVNQERAINHWMKHHPGYIPQLSVPGSVTFLHKETKLEVTKSVSSMEAEYNNMKRTKEEQRKQMKKGLKDGRKPKSNPIRSPRRSSQISLTGENW